MNQKRYVIQNTIHIVFIMVILQSLGFTIATADATPGNGSPIQLTSIGFTERVSVASDGTQANANSGSSSNSQDGRYVAFVSYASNLVSGDTNEWDDIFVYDRQADITTRVSVASDGTQGNDWSYTPSISADGRYVAFQSASTNLVSDDSNGFFDIFVHDRQTGTTTLVSVASDGSLGNNASNSTSISADGRYVAFLSGATNLVSEDTNLGHEDVFVHDRQTGQTSLVSRASDGTQGIYGSSSPSISADGRFVAFSSFAYNLVSEDTNNMYDIFVHDRQTGATTRVSVASDGTQGDDDSIGAYISADGRYVAFSSEASNLVDGDTNSKKDTFVHDLQTGATTRVSVASDGAQGNMDSGSASISADGRFVAFNSLAYNLISGDTNSDYDVFVHDRQTGATTVASVASDGTQGYGFSSRPSISADGRYVAFESNASNLVSGDTQGHYDIFVRDRLGVIKPWMLMFYLDGDNNLDHTYPPIVNQLEAEGGNPDVSVSVVWDRLGSGNSAYYWIQPDPDLNNLANYQEGVNRWSKGELNMGSGQTLIDFVNWSKFNFPAGHYALILSDHGSGLGGGMVDVTNNDDHLTVMAMGQALNSITRAGANKIDVLYMDASLMGMLEDAYQFRNSALYYVASENIQWAYSQPYSGYISDITAATTPADMARIFTNSYANVAQTEYDAHTMSAGDLSQLGAVVSANNTLAQILNSNMATHAQTLSQVAEIVQRYEMNEDDVINASDDYIDLYDFALKLKGLSVDSQIDQACDAIMTAVDNYIILNRNSDINYPKWNLQNSHGVSIFFPSSASSFYNSGNYDFAVGATWPGSIVSLAPGTPGAGVDWGPMLVNYFQTTQPGGPDNPNPPAPVERQDPSIYLFMPLVVR